MATRKHQGKHLVRYGAITVCILLSVLALLTNFSWVTTYGNIRGPSSTIRINTQMDQIEEVELPPMQWEEVSECPVPRLDGAAVQIKNYFYVFAGYANINQVHTHVDIFDLSNNTWIDRFDMPKEMAHSHLGMVTDGRYVYIVTGQYGPQCRGPTALNFVLDTQTKTWDKLPPLPLPRYAPATQLWKGRLHVMGGSKEDRWEPALEHWSIGVNDGKAVELNWRNEIPIPRGGPHRACIVREDSLYVIGGQEGDFKPKPGSPIFKCSRQKEEVYGDVYMLEDLKSTWKVMPPMPKSDSHIEFAWVLVNDSALILGGTTDKNPITKRMVLVGDVFQYNFTTMRWRIIGQMPYRVKTTLVAYWDGWLYFTSGQRDKSVDDPSPKKVVAKTWRTKLVL